jgi:hypothetical protein
MNFSDFIVAVVITIVFDASTIYNNNYKRWDFEKVETMKVVYIYG